jgi:hypothetical protein
MNRAEAIATEIVDQWHEEYFGLRIDDHKLRVLRRRIACALQSQCYCQPTGEGFLVCPICRPIGRQRLTPKQPSD